MLTEKELQELKEKLFELSNNDDLGAAISAVQILERMSEIENPKLRERLQKVEDFIDTVKQCADRPFLVEEAAELLKEARAQHKEGE